MFSGWKARSADAKGAFQWIFRSGAHQRVTPEFLLSALRLGRSGPLGYNSIFRLYADAKPDIKAIHFKDLCITWGELNQAIDEIATGLCVKLGLHSGDALVLMLRNRPEFLIFQAAAARLGVSIIPISWRSTADDLGYILKHSQAQALVIGPEEAGWVATASLPIALHQVVCTSQAHPSMRTQAELRETPVQSFRGQRERVVMYTSGTTGKPKGANRRLAAKAPVDLFMTLTEFPFRVDDRHLVVCPLYHAIAFGFTGINLAFGAEVHLQERFEPEAFLAKIERSRITTTALVPTMLHQLLSLPEATLRRYDTRSLRAIFSGGAPLSGTLARRTIETFGHVLYNFYGATETGINTLATPQELLDAPGTIGHLLPGNEARLLDAQGHPVPAGQTGELYIRNGMLIDGYTRNAKATRDSMKNGYFSVGDLGHVDARGLYFLDGRKKDMIVSGGVNVYPAEVEEVLSTHPEIREVAIVGSPDPQWGETVHAFITGASSLSTEALDAWCRLHLASPKRPRHFHLVDALPRNPTGKVQKKQLRASLREGS